jgi:hypothetical protein
MLKNKEKELIISMIIGDGNVSKIGEKRYRLFIGHGENQKDYCEWKMNLLNNSGIFDNHILLHTKLAGKDKSYLQYFFSKENIMIKYFYDLFIIERKKTIKNVLKYMKTPISTAIWFMDDGGVEPSRKKQTDGSVKYYRPNLKLCTHSFSYDDNVLIQKWFKNKYNIECSIREEKKKRNDNVYIYYFLRFNADNTEKLYKEVLKDYVCCCKSMKNKFKYLIRAYK